MPLHWRPVGPEPALTYWQRRAVVLVALLLLPLLVGAVVVSGGDPDTVAGPRSSPSAAPSSPSSPAAASPAVSPSPSVVPCTDDLLDVTATADREQYPVGGRPRLVLTVTNTGSAPCSRDLGQAAVELLVVSGADRIWSSDDCAPGGDVKLVVLAPKQESVTRLTWDARRSRPGCSGAKEPAAAGTYRVNARLGQTQISGQPFRFE